MKTLVLSLAAVLGLLIGSTAPRAQGPALPPLTGPAEPKVEPIRGEDGIYHQAWFNQSFMDLKDDHAEARTEGKRFAVIFEQRGCVYCTKMHTEVLAQRYVNDYVRDNFRIVQIDIWGSREVTDFDGRKMPEKTLAERWSVLFTPTIVFLKEELEPGRIGPPVEVARMNLGIGAGTFYDMFAWVRAKVYETDRNFQRFHVARTIEREKLK